MGFLHGGLGPRVLELGRLSLQPAVEPISVTMVVLAVLDGFRMVVMLFGHDFASIDRLHRSVVMVLMDFAVYRCGCFLMVLFGHRLIGDSGSIGLVNCGIMFPIPGPAG